MHCKETDQKLTEARALLPQMQQPEDYARNKNPIIMDIPEPIHHRCAGLVLEPGNECLLLESGTA